MVEARLKEWLNRDDRPADFYQLVGQPRLCRNRDGLLDSFQAAGDYLFQCQNHKDKQVRERALAFQRLLAEARRTVSDENRWQEYDQNLISQLYQLYSTNPTFSGPSCNVNDLRRWLALVQQVDSERIEELIGEWTKKRREQKPPGETDTVSATGTTRTKLISPPPRTVVAAEDAPPDDSNLEFQAYRVDYPKTPPPVPERSKGMPPLPAQKSPPPLPTKDLPAIPPAPTPPPKPAVPRQPSVPGRRTDSNLWRDYQPVWIGLAVFLSLFILGVMFLLFAWAAGAFDGSHSRASSSAQNIPAVTQLPTNLRNRHRAPVGESGGGRWVPQRERD